MFAPPRTCQVRGSRQARAIAKSTRFGRKEQEGVWNGQTLARIRSDFQANRVPVRTHITS
jgi:hypothetical protein